MHVEKSGPDLTPAGIAARARVAPPVPSRDEQIAGLCDEAREIGEGYGGRELEYWWKERVPPWKAWPRGSKWPRKKWGGIRYLPIKQHSMMGWGEAIEFFLAEMRGYRTFELHWWTLEHEEDPSDEDLARLLRYSGFASEDDDELVDALQHAYDEGFTYGITERITEYVQDCLG